MGRKERKTQISVKEAFDAGMRRMAALQGIAEEEITAVSVSEFFPNELGEMFYGNVGGREGIIFSKDKLSEESKVITVVVSPIQSK